MWGEPVPQAVRQVVDKGNIAEDIALAEIEAVGLEGKKTVGGKDDDVPAGLKDPYCFLNRLSVVINMLQNFVQEDHIEHIIKREFLRRGNEGLGGYFLGFLNPLGINVNPVKVIGESFESLEVGADPAANIKNLASLKGDVVSDHLKPALLPESPDIAWCSQFGDLVIFH